MTETNKNENSAEDPHSVQSDVIPFLSPAEHERLAVLAEEMGEAIQVIGKILRHGYESYHPLAKSPTNREMLEKELGDVQIAVGMLVAAGDLKEKNIEKQMDLKCEKIAKHLHYQEV